MNGNTLYICFTHGIVPIREVERVEIFDCQTKETSIVLEHIVRKPGKCFQKVKHINIDKKSIEASES
jgi:hypothetical protein